MFLKTGERRHWTYPKHSPEPEDWLLGELCLVFLTLGLLPARSQLREGTRAVPHSSEAQAGGGRLSLQGRQCGTPGWEQQPPRGAWGRTGRVREWCRPRHHPKLSLVDTKSWFCVFMSVTDSLKNKKVTDDVKKQR